MQYRGNAMHSFLEMFSTIAEGYNTTLNDRGDERVKDWFLMSSPIPTIIISILYSLSVKVLGPWLMRDRESFQLRTTLIVYNFFQVLFSTWIFCHGWDNVWGRGFSLRCHPVDYSTSPAAMRIVRGFWWFYISKFTEFFDTFFFIMRKKYDQVSTLHVIHHGIMPLSVWFGAKFAPGGDSVFVSNINTFVHMVMYTYYMLAAVGPHMQKYLWWKKYLTVLQLVQFIMVFGNALKLLSMGCDYPKAYALLIMFDSTLFFVLFYNFYQNSYKENRKKKMARNKKDDDCGSAADGTPSRCNKALVSKSSNAAVFKLWYMIEITWRYAKCRMMIERKINK